jgi:importin subunit beta-1
MQVVCEATQNSNVQVQIGAFECLVRIMSLYYDKMAFYMERALFGVSSLPPISDYILSECSPSSLCKG